MKGVYFKTEGLTQDQLREMYDIMVEAGAEVWDIYTETQGYDYYGIDFDEEIRVYHESDPYGVDSVEVEPTPEALREALSLLPKVVEEVKEDVIPIRNVKLRLLNAEHSKAFQVAVFESDGEWISGETVPKLVLAPYLFVDSEGTITYGDKEYHFNQHAYKEITFTAKTTWEVAYAKPKTHTLNGEYTNEELLKLIHGDIRR